MTSRLRSDSADSYSGRYTRELSRANVIYVILERDNGSIACNEISVQQFATINHI